MTRIQKFWTLFFILAGLVFAFIYKIGDILFPFLIAFLFSYLLTPFVQFLQNYGLKKSLSIWIVFSLFSLLFLSIGTSFIFMIREEIPAVQSKIPLYIDYLQNNTIPEVENLFHIKLQKRTQEYIKDFTEKLMTLSPEMASSISNFASQAFSKTINVLIFFIDLLLIPVVTVYFLFDFEKIGIWIPTILPLGYQPRLKQHLQEIHFLLRRFIGGQLLISSVLAIIYVIGLSWIGLDFSVILGFFSGLMNIVPYMGVFTGAIISTLFVFFKYHDFTHTLLVISLFFTGHLLDGYYLNPKIVGKQIGLHPLIVILSILIGGKIFGLFGLIFSVPAAAILNYLIKAGFDSYQKSKIYTDPL